MYFIYFALIVCGLSINKIGIYVLFALLCTSALLKKQCTLSDKLLICSLYSIIVPDNYLTLICFFGYALCILIRKKKIILRNSSFFVCFLLLISMTIFSALISNTSIVNLFFSAITFLPLFLFFVLLNTEIPFTQTLLIEKPINDVFFIELISVPIDFILMTNNDDWCCGTFIGNGEQAQFFVICAFLLLYYIYCFRRTRDSKKYIWRVFTLLGILVLTHCWTLTIVLGISIMMFLLFLLNKKAFFIFVLLIIFCPIALSAFRYFNPEKYSQIILATKNSSYFNYRFHKLITYHNTFIDIPLADLKFALFGAGIGNFNSRAALICTGEYVSFYNHIFNPHLSPYTKKYIYDFLHFSQTVGGDYGSVLARPYSSILSLMGECGYCGLILFVVMLNSIRKKSGMLGNCLIAVWIGVCFVENYFEYPKVILILFALLQIIKDTNGFITIHRKIR